MFFRTLALTSLLAVGSTVCADDAAKPAQSEDEVAVGKPAPDFTATGIDGEEFTLSEKLKDKEHHILLVFSRANW